VVYETRETMPIRLELLDQRRHLDVVDVAERRTWAVCTVVGEVAFRHRGGMEAIALNHVWCRFGNADEEVVALADVSCAIGVGAFVAVMGATGSGKSTLLNCAAGLERPTQGVVQLLGQDIGEMSERALSRFRRDRVGFVFQSYNLLSGLTVEQNVLLPWRLGAKEHRELGDVLAAVGLIGYEDRSVGALSGGQRQRVAIARALVTRSSVIFADEPTGALDPTTGSQMLALLRRAVDQDGVSVMMVSHDPHAAAVSDRLMLLRAGRLVFDGPTPGVDKIASMLADVSNFDDLKVPR
jgi:putative ABC transport system ATP-binding protein